MRISNSIHCAVIVVGAFMGVTLVSEPCLGQIKNWLPAKDFRWRIPVANDPADEERLKKILDQADKKSFPLMPKPQALSIGDFLLMRSPVRMIAVEFSSGKRIWEYPWTVAPKPPARSGAYETRRTNQLRQRILQDSPYGQFSTDGESVFFLDDVGYLPIGQPPVAVRIGGRVAPVVDRSTSNYLVALNVERQGAMSWKVGGPKDRKESDEPKLAGAFFLGAPTVVGDSLFVMAELNDKIQLLVLEADSGKIDWSVDLAKVGGRNIVLDHVRRLAGAQPVVSGGRVVCITTPKKIIGVSLEDKSVSWSYEYDDDAEAPQRVGIRIERIVAAEDKRWADAKASVAGDYLLVTAYESSKLHCINLADGEFVWKRDRGNSLFVEVIDQEVGLIIGTTSVEAINVADGKSKWKEAVNLDSLPSGRGFHHEGFYYLPTRDANIFRIEIESGKVVDRIKLKYPLGNLLVVKDNLVSHGPDWIMAFRRGQDIEDEK